MSSSRPSRALALLCIAPFAASWLACSDRGTLPTQVASVSTLESAASPARTFKMRGTVLLVAPVVPPPPPCFALLESVIEGHATHLGRFAGTGSTCILIDIANPVPDPNPPFLPAGPGPYLTAPFTNPLWTLTAANGDELWLESDDAVAVISAVDGSLRAMGSHRIIGGTGRFAGATGESATTGVNVDGLGPDDMESEGWIAY